MVRLAAEKGSLVKENINTQEKKEMENDPGLSIVVEPAVPLDRPNVFGHEGVIIGSEINLGLYFYWWGCGFLVDQSQKCLGFS
jgi:hypothetical protein